MMVKIYISVGSLESKVEEIIGSVNQNQREGTCQKKKKKWCDSSIYEICYLTSWSSRKELRENTWGNFQRQFKRISQNWNSWTSRMKETNKCSAQWIWKLLG